MDEWLRLLSALWSGLVYPVPPAVRATLVAAPHLLLWGAGLSAGLCGGILLIILGVRLLHGAQRAILVMVAPAPDRARRMRRRLARVGGVRVGVGMLLLYAGTLAWHASPLRAVHPRRPPRSAHRGQ